MVSSKELRAAMYRADHDGPLYDSDADTLAAAVRELYEALVLYQCGPAELLRDEADSIDETVARYRAALEGGQNETGT